MNTSAISNLPICWVNELSGNPNFPGSTVCQIKFAKEEGHIVVNAARPLPGTKTWQGMFRCGIYYAAGDPARFGQIWSDLDAKELRAISNEEILRAVIEEGYRRGYKNQIQEAVRGFTPEDLAQQADCWVDMPFFAEEASATWQQMLDAADWSPPEE